MSDKSLKIICNIGLITPVLVLVCILLSVASWDQFSWTNNALSDLGVQAGIISNLFNGSIVLGGLFFIIFSLEIFKLVKQHVVGKIGASLLVVSFVAFTSIGIFNSSFNPTHYIVAVSFFVTFPFALLLLGCSFWFLGEKKIGLFTLGTTFIAALPWVLQFTFQYVQNIAIPEFVSGVVMAVWVMTLSYFMPKMFDTTKTLYE